MRASDARNSSTKRFALTAFLATALCAGVYAWWVYQNAPGGAVAGPMYAWIRHFFGAVAVCLASLVAAFVTFVIGLPRDPPAA